MAFGMDSLSQHFDGHCLTGDSATTRLIRKMLQRLGPQRLESLARRMRLLTLMEEKALEGQITFSITHGIVKRLAFMPTGYFQAENVVSSRSVGALTLKKISSTVRLPNSTAWDAVVKSLCSYTSAVATMRPSPRLTAQLCCR
jgi:hypothetical protein